MSKQNTYRRITAFLGSDRFFLGVVAVFVLQAAWIALSGRYPMAFDEDFHLGVIRLYADHLSPFWSAQPSSADTFGAVFRDPSYLYHWLMSFPYRLLAAFTDNQTAQVLLLRALNISFFAAGLVLYRRLLLRTGASRAIVHAVLLIFVLIPVVPLLAAQINYDNFFLPLLGVILLLALRFNDGLVRRKRVDTMTGLTLLLLCMFASLVKYAFLPMFVAIIAFIIIRLWQTKVTTLTRPGRLSGPLVVVLLIVMAGLFIERYGVNLARYHNPVPDCVQALSVEACDRYGPWARDHYLESHKSPDAPESPVIFAGAWLYGMWLRLFFAVDGPATGFQTRGPLIVPGLGAVAFAAAGALATLVYARRLFRMYNAPALGLLLLVSGVYVTVLWADGYQAFLRTGQPVAINGRYLLPVLPFLFLVSALAINEFCRRRQALKLAVGGLAVFCLLWGGGALTYILRSNPAWYWPTSPLTDTNQTVRDILGPVTPGYDNGVKFLP